MPIFGHPNIAAYACTTVRQFPHLAIAACERPPLGRPRHQPHQIRPPQPAQGHRLWRRPRALSPQRLPEFRGARNRPFRSIISANPNGKHLYKKTVDYETLYDRQEKNRSVYFSVLLLLYYDFWDNVCRKNHFTCHRFDISVFCIYYVFCNLRNN